MMAAADEAAGAWATPAYRCIASAPGSVSASRESVRVCLVGQVPSGSRVVVAKATTICEGWRQCVLHVMSVSARFNHAISRTDCSRYTGEGHS
jgi:hypothetical protein